MLNAMMGGAETAAPVDAVDLAFGAMGTAAWLPKHLRAQPGEALALVPWVVDEAAWAQWIDV